MYLNNDDDEIQKIKREKEKYIDKIRGSMIGGAAGDALGYAVEFENESGIFEKYGPNGITHYHLDFHTGKALISDDTQMALFTANGILYGQTRVRMRGIGGKPYSYVVNAYLDWLNTQENTYEEGKTLPRFSWLMDVPELYAWRAPGGTCLTALGEIRSKQVHPGDINGKKINDSKGCGGIMRIAPLALRYDSVEMEELDTEGARLAAITHTHSLGYLPAAVLTHIINKIVYHRNQNESLKDIVLEAKNTVARLFRSDPHIGELENLIDLAIALSENADSDLNNIHKLGQGWVAEETLAIAIYCSLKYEDDFSAGLIASVNHNGDSDSTGAVTGNILGAICGYSSIDQKWKENLELHDVITEIADDLCYGCLMKEYGTYRDQVWITKYINNQRYI